MSPSEVALSDAEKMNSAMMSVFAPSDEGNILSSTNREFIRLFMRDVVSPNEVNALTTREGDLSQAGIARIRNAVFAKAFGDVEVLERLAESTDNNVRNITNGMLTALAGLMKVKAGIEDGTLYPVDISRDITAAMRKLSDIRNQGITYEDYLKNPEMFDTMTPAAKIILGIFNLYSRSAKKIGEWLNFYADEAQGSPKADLRQGVLFGTEGERTAPTKAEMIESATKKMEAFYGPVKESAQPDLFPGKPAGGGQADHGERPEIQKPGETGKAPHAKPGQIKPEVPGTAPGAKTAPGPRPTILPPTDGMGQGEGGGAGTGRAPEQRPGQPPGGGPGVGIPISDHGGDEGAGPGRPGLGTQGNVGAGAGPETLGGPGQPPEGVPSGLSQADSGLELEKAKEEHPTEGTGQLSFRTRMGPI